MKRVRRVVQTGAIDIPKALGGSIKLDNAVLLFLWRRERDVGRCVTHGYTVSVTVGRNGRDASIGSTGSSVHSIDIISGRRRYHDEIQCFWFSGRCLNRNSSRVLSLEFPIPPFSRHFVVGNHDAVIEPRIIVTAIMLCQQPRRFLQWVESHIVVPNNIQRNVLIGRNVLHAETVGRAGSWS